MIRKTRIKFALGGRFPLPVGGVCLFISGAEMGWCGEVVTGGRNSIARVADDGGFSHKDKYYQYYRSEFEINDGTVNWRFTDWHFFVMKKTANTHRS